MRREIPVNWFPLRLRARKPSEGTSLRFDAASFTPRIQTQLLILQPTPFCNIACDYCYLPHRNSTAKMSIDTVRQAAQRLRDDGLAGPALTVVWHAGEPLVMPVSFYDEAIAAISEVFGSQCVVTHSIQTNGTLIDEAWCALFLRHGIRVGISVDGPAQLHDKHRHTRSGHGTHDKVVAAMARLRQHGIPFHAIAVVTADTFARADEFFDFFVEQGVTELGCNFDEAEGSHQTSSLVNAELAHGAFVEHLLARSCDRAGLPSIRELAIAARLIGRPMETYTWQGRVLPANAQTQPFALISVAHDGSFSCFSPELLGQPSAEFENFVLGNVATMGYLESAASPAFLRLWNAIVRGTEACERSCSHFGFCGGGAPANKLYENGDFASTETLYCRTMFKRPFDAVLTSLEREKARRTALGAAMTIN